LHSFLQYLPENELQQCDMVSEFLLEESNVLPGITVSCLLHWSCYRNPVCLSPSSPLMSPFTFLPSNVSCLRSPSFPLMPSVTFLPSHVLYLLSPSFPLLSPVTFLPSYVSCHLPSLSCLLSPVTFLPSATDYCICPDVKIVFVQMRLFYLSR
jgi:hypothetical protein